MLLSEALLPATFRNHHASIEKLSSRIADGEALLQRPALSLAEIDSWREVTRHVLKTVFVESSSEPSRILNAGPAHQVRDAATAHLVSAKDRERVGSVIARLRATIEMIRVETADAILERPVSSPRESAQAKSEAASIFLVHGRDDAAKNEVARFVERETGLPVTILHEQANRGATIIEKFEEHAGFASFAVVLLTADDIGGLSTEQGSGLQPRARQNVVFELGYFVAKLGREKVCALVAPGVEQPSDFVGVVYVRFDGSSGWKYELQQELRSAGLIARP